MATCAFVGGCPSDYIAVLTSILALILLLARATVPFLVFKAHLPKGGGLWVPIIQIFASFNLILSLIVPSNFIASRKRHWWQFCYVWAVWVEGPLGFGLLLSCRIVQALQLYYIFSKKRLPPIRSYISLPMILFPWIAAAAFIHTKRPLNPRCHMNTQWIVPLACLHIFYVTALMGFTWAIRNIEFRFHELKDLWHGILVSALSVGIWIFAYIFNELHDDIGWLQVFSRFVLLISASILILALFSMSSSQPLISQMSLTKRDGPEFNMMGHALGIPHSGVFSEIGSPRFIDPSQPLDRLLQNRRFRQSFMEFADSCLAGESVHFFDEVHELSKIPEDDSTRRIYMARHIIEQYIVSGASMEVNISHRGRQEIMGTLDLSDPDLFNNALNEVIQLMKMSIANDYWSSMYYMKFIEHDDMRLNEHEMEQFGSCNFSPRLSLVQGTDDPFHQDQDSFIGLKDVQL